MQIHILDMDCIGWGVAPFNGTASNHQITNSSFFLLTAPIKTNPLTLNNKLTVDTIGMCWDIIRNFEAEIVPKETSARN